MANGQMARRYGLPQRVMLEAYQQPPIDAAVAEALAEHVERRSREIGDEEI